MKEATIALEGVGKFTGKYGSIDDAGAPFMEGHLVNCNISIDASEAELFGGEGKMALEKTVTQKTIGITATSSHIRIQTVLMTQGTDAVDSEVVPMTKFGELVTVPSGTPEIAFDDLDEVTATTGPTDAGCYRENENVIFEYADGSGRLELGATAAAGVFEEDTTDKKWVFHASDAGKELVVTYCYNYDYASKHENDNITSTYINSKTNNCPFAMFYDKNFEACSEKKKFQAYFMKVIASGKFSLPFAAGDYSKPDFELSVIDPILPTGRVGIITVQNDT